MAIVKRAPARSDAGLPRGRRRARMGAAPMLTISALALLILLDPCLAQGAASRKSGETFEAIVLKHFDHWDANRNGVLSVEEIDGAVVDPARRGAEAAALAALKIAVRDGKFSLPEITREYLLTKRDVNKTDSGDDGDVDADTDRDAAASRPSGGEPNFRLRFARALKKIESPARDLYLDPTPDIDRCRQGPLGDCFFVAVAGAIVHRDPRALRAIIEVGGDGTYTIDFPGYNSVTIPPLSDAEVGLTSSTGEGLWLPVLEKAFGTLRMREKPENQQSDEPTDAIARGGSIAFAMRALTGRATETLTLRREFEKLTKGPGDASLAFERRVGSALEGAVAAYRLAGASTGKDALPPGIQGKHAYAILAFHSERGAVSLWNPHGNNFRPKGKPGLANGYITKAGRFEAPLSEFIQIFRTLVIETDRPGEAKTAKPKKKNK